MKIKIEMGEIVKRAFVQVVETLFGDSFTLTESLDEAEAVITGDVRKALSFLKDEKLVALVVSRDEKKNAAGLENAPAFAGRFKSFEIGAIVPIFPWLLSAKEKINENPGR